jgi:hypothetical protein
MTANACLHQQELWLSLHYLNSTDASLVQNKQDNNETNNSTKQRRKYIVLLRDPADWLWAAWIFWVDHGLDTDTKTGDWTKSGAHYRYPELFHELILSGDKTVSGDYLLTGLRRDTVTIGRRLMALGGRDNVIFLRNEEVTDTDHVAHPLEICETLQQLRRRRYEYE